MSTQDFLAKSAFTNLEQSIELALSQTEGFRDEAENFADLARRGIRLVPPGVVADLSSFPSNPEGGDAVLVESEDQIYFFDSDSSTWKDSKIIGSAIFANIQGDPSDNTALQTALDGKVNDEFDEWTPFLTFGGDPSGFVYNRNEGFYIRLRDVVIYTGSISWTDIGTGTGRANLEGFPFLPKNSDRARSSLNVGRARSISFNGSLGGFNSILDPLVILIDKQSGDRVNLDESNFSTNGLFDFSIIIFSN